MTACPAAPADWPAHPRGRRHRPLALGAPVALSGRGDGRQGCSQTAGRLLVDSLDHRGRRRDVRGLAPRPRAGARGPWARRSRETTPRTTTWPASADDAEDDDALRLYALTPASQPRRILTDAQIAALSETATSSCPAFFPRSAQRRRRGSGLAATLATPRRLHRGRGDARGPAPARRRGGAGGVLDLFYDRWKLDLTLAMPAYADATATSSRCDLRLRRRRRAAPLGPPYLGQQGRRRRRAVGPRRRTGAACPTRRARNGRSRAR